MDARQRQNEELRRRAEELLTKSKKNLQSIPPDDIQRLIHELNVQHMELEIQNEELRQAQEEIVESRNRYFDLYDLAPVGYLTLDENRLIHEVNLTVADLLGQKRRFLIKRGFSHYIAPDSQKVFHQHYQKVLETGKKQSCELKMTKKDGVEFYVLLKSILTRNKEEKPNFVRIAMMNITDRKQAEEALEMHRQQLEETVRKRTVELSKTNEMLMAEISERKKAELELKARQKEIKKLNINLEKRVKEEVEKSRQKDFIMMHQARLAAMGEMIGHIAHQWKQPINALNILLFNIKDNLSDAEPNQEILDNLIERGGVIIRRMSKIIDDFRDFFKPDKGKEKFCLNEAVKDVLSIIEADFRHNHIDVIVHEKDQTNIVGYSNEYSQSLLNIITNAVDAIVAKEMKEGKLIIEIYCENDSAIVKVTDNGGGIPENILSRIFEPYFTTKEDHKGTGLGLYMARLIIEEHGQGQIKAQNITGGAEFTIIVPVNPGPK